MSRQAPPAPDTLDRLLQQEGHKRPSGKLRYVNYGLAGVTIGLLLLVVGRRAVRFATGQDIVEQVAVEVTQDAQEFQPPPPTTAVEPQEQEQVASAGETVVFERVTDPYTDVPERARRQVIRYEVQEGDTIFGLAERFELDPNTIFWANTETLQDNIHLISIGLPLYILPTDGVYHTASGDEAVSDIAAQFGVEPGAILESPYNALHTNDPNYVPPKGMHLVVEGGSREYISWQSPLIRTGDENATSPEAVELHPGACRAVYTGVGGTGVFAHPLGGGPVKVTTGFFPFHPGVDMSANPGTPVFAADSGIVVFAGRHTGGYGTLVILDHGGGFTSYYAHLNARYVECGDSVIKGEPIGEVGSTGFSSGAHLHFEIRKDHRPQSPYLYVDIPDIRTGG